ncbi:1-hydroxycarotenoid 3,4-desaturase CrtD [Desertivirga xinjiangensis]|uniref:1-hydroxycarotenoid 3,4-desaturase CrtD n=1 Tax=Desertivirga xinjiangensis TaxID=539206 RepID=UPI00210EAE22|nr:1-hydroxycarotenoid 3,4-desaturase CrtD [Pedobacter xinjiangensis]
MPKAIIVGAGIAGIASAIRLAVKGFQVDIYEKNSYPGGKLSEIEQDGYRFDAGPSLLTMPHYVDELFLLAGRKPEDYFRYRKLDSICNYFYEDGTRISAWADSEKLAEEFEAKTADSADAIKRFLKKSAEIYKLTHHVFLERSLHRLATYTRLKTLFSFLKLRKIDSFRTMNQANSSMFHDSRTLRFFNRYATYNGSDPYQAPATLNVIPHLEQHFGAFFPEGGMNAITLSLVKLAEELGVNFHYSTSVEEIVVAENTVKGIKTDNGSFTADIVVSNLDVWFTYRKLLKTHIPEKILNQERSSSALIFYWGVSREFQELDLHNIFFSEDYEQEFRSIWGVKQICDDPTIYLNISSKYKHDDAPEGAENWFVMINVPSDAGQDWDQLIEQARECIIRKLSRNLGVDVKEFIGSESILDPRSIEYRTGSYQGSLYGSSSNNRFAAFFRHANFSSKFRNLYFAGGSVHPGGGIPLALLSAKIVAEDIKI